jgi:hypothetical protein
MSPARGHASLRQALDDFREAWQEGMPMELHESAAHVEPDDALGDPAMTERFRRFLLGGLNTPIRRALRWMANGNTRDRAEARFLFVLACHGFDIRAAAYAIGGCHCDAARHARPRDCPRWHLPIDRVFADAVTLQAITRAFAVAGWLLEPRIGKLVRRACAVDGCDVMTPRRLCERHLAEDA